MWQHDGFAEERVLSRAEREQVGSARVPRRLGRGRAWETQPVEDLLDIRLCDLGLAIAGTPLADRVDRVLDELARRAMRFRPHFWLSDEWFSPGGVPGVAIPFYLAHPRLARLERAQMLEVEGGSQRDCLRLLRHEVGHAIQHGYELHRRRRWQKIFGRSTVPYPDHYRPNPSSKRFVQHLDAWYAQSHPAEDFAESFAVWLQPRSDWRRRYAGWPAIRKLEYVDELMHEIADERPRVVTRQCPDSLSRLRKTLREHYEEKRSRYSVGFSNGYDRELCRLFSAARVDRQRQTAAAFLRAHRRDIREQVARWTGENRFTLDYVLKEMIGRSSELGLRVAGDSSQIRLDFAIVLTVHTLRCLRSKHWHPL